MGDLWVDPQTGEVWKCTCTNVIIKGQQQVVCQWRGILLKPQRSTWININSALFMDVEGVSNANGAKIHQWTYTGAGNQYWDMDNPSDAYVTATSANSRKCLAVLQGSKSYGAQIVQWDCNGNLDQKWYWTWTGYRTSDGWPVWNLINANSNMCLGISGASTSVGANAVQWECNGSFDQMWY